MSELVKVEGYTNLAKDVHNGGVINLDRRAYESHKLARNIAMKNIQELSRTKTNVDSLQSEINSIKEDIGMIKEMLFLLTQKGK
jgi:hypothetical protein